MNIKKYNSIFKKQNTKINELSKNKKHKHKNQAVSKKKQNINKST